MHYVKTRAKIFWKRSSTQKVFRTNLHAYIYTTTWNKYTSTKNTYCSFRFLSHPAYLEAPASTGRPLWWQSYHFSRGFGTIRWSFISKSPRPSLIVSSFRPKNWIRGFLRACTVFKSFIGIRGRFLKKMALHFSRFLKDRGIIYSRYQLRQLFNRKVAYFFSQAEEVKKTMDSPTI